MLFNSWFAFGRNKNNPNRRRRSRPGKRNDLAIQLLEDRCLLAGIFFNAGEVTIAGDSGNDVASFVQTDPATYVASLIGFPNQSFTASTVTKVIFIGFAGNDVLTNSTSVESLMLGNDGIDTITGGPGIDVINGGAGNDQISGGAGNDRLIGNNGNDTINGGDGNDRMFGGEGINQLNGDDGDDLMFGGDEVDLMHGGNGADQIFPLGGDDIVYLGDGGTPGATDPSLADLVIAGAGNDIMSGGNGLNIFYGGDGDDTFNGGNGENRMHGQNGNDILNSGTSNDYLAGQLGNDTINAGGGNDYILPGFGDDVVNAGTGNDFVVFSFAFTRYQITTDGTQLFVDDKNDVDGTDTVASAENFRFSDGDRVAKAGFTQRVTVQPIIASNTNGTNTAEFFGSGTAEADIKFRIDAIYAIAGIDVHWLAPRSYNNTFANIGNGGSRPQGDLTTVVTQGDTAGVGNSNPLILDMYFVEIAAGFSDSGEDSSNGLAFVNDNGITIHVGDNLVGFEDGRKVVARVAAHEIAHNLGLDHVGPATNLMSSGTNLTASQITTMLNSSFTIPG